MKKLEDGWDLVKKQTIELFLRGKGILIPTQSRKTTQSQAKYKANAYVAQV